MFAENFAMHAPFIGRRTSWIALLIIAGAAAPAAAKVMPHPLFSDNAVLQQGMPLPVFGTADDDEPITVELQGQKLSTMAHGGKWRVQFRPMTAGGPYTLKISGNSPLEIKNVMVGEVWVCSGQSNMQWPVSAAANGKEAIARSANAQIRLINIPRVGAAEPKNTFDDRQLGARWAECGPGSVAAFSAVGYFFGRDLQRDLKVPIGLIGSNVGGTPVEAWTSETALLADPQLRPVAENSRRALANHPQAMEQYNKVTLPKWQAQAAAAKQAGKTPPRRPNPPLGPTSAHPAGLYNAMISPLVDFPIRGAIWYQGEANASQGIRYRTAFAAMIADWRREWHEPNMPFLFVQLAPFQPIREQPGESHWAELREAQLLTMQNVPNTAMAVITDVGEEHDIHPKKKEPVGHRLALAARALAYGEAVEYSGPLYKSMQVEGSRALISFTHLGGGLVASDGPLKGFTVCGDDHKFVPADAAIDGDRVVVSSGEVSHPVAVRFGWADYPVVNLWNEAGLPASPFRTDDFPVLSSPKR
jgi:sialate O-acetylesterase